MFSFIKSYFKRNKSHDVLKLLNSGDLFFDIGAHLGEKSKKILDKNLTIVMLEPLPQCVKQLRENFKNIKNVQILEKAVGRTVGNMTLEVNSKEIIPVFCDNPNNTSSSNPSTSILI